MNLFKKQLEYLLEEKDIIALLSNLSAFLNENLEDINWVGFYLLKNNELVLGPFQGKVACTRIKVGSGVCGTALLNKQTLIVDNVHKFEGHIACDSRSNSEIVVPIINKDNKAIGVIDVDSISFNRFTNKEKDMLEFVASKLSELLNI